MGRRVSRVAVVAWLVLVSGTAVAQPKLERSFEIQNYDPAVGPRQYFTLEGTEMPEHLGFGVGLDFTFQGKPLAIYEVQDDTLENENTVVDYQGTFFLTGFFGIRTRGLAGGDLFRKIQFGLSLPLYLQNGHLDVSPYPLPTSTPSEVRGFAVGDLRIQVKTSIWRFWMDRVRLAFGTVLTLPWVGDIPNYQAQNNFAGEKNVTIRPRFIGEFVLGELRAVANVGVVIRPEPSTFLSTEVGSQFFYGVGGQYDFWSGMGMTIGALAELVGRNGFSRDLDANPLEADAGVRLAFAWGLSVTAGAGAGIIKAVGSPQWRVFAAVRWSPNWTDADGDGVPDYKDRCPNQAEDRDGFQDGDGCPEADNDRDGIPDVRDKCPDQAEDFDRFKDQDGCPDLDNDGDGIPDAKDNCPMNKGPAKTKGCPADLLDDDGDNVPNVRDKCPKEEEDKDGYQDGDGCPDPDNDGDGVCDPNDTIQDNLAKFAKVCQGKDKCNSDPEDRDGYQDGDGCPDPDNDGDHFCDDNPVIQKKLQAYSNVCVGRDACPDKPEVINGRADADGCPDAGEPDVVIQGEKVVLRRPVVFKRTSTRFAGASKVVLTELAWILRWRLDSFAKLVVVGFVEPEMRKSKALRVSQAWADAVKAYLVRLGLPEDKILAKGLGGARPVYTGRSRRKSRKLNRRVEFYLVK